MISKPFSIRRRSYAAAALFVWTNSSHVPVRELWWHLYLNAFRDERSTFAIESKGVTGVVFGSIHGHRDPDGRKLGAPCARQLGGVRTRGRWWGDPLAERTSRHRTTAI